MAVIDLQRAADLCVVAAKTARAAGFNQGMGKGVWLAVGVLALGLGGAYVIDTVGKPKQKQTPAQLPPANQALSPSDSRLLGMLVSPGARLIE